MKNMDLGITAGLFLLSGVLIWVKRGAEAFFEGYAKKRGEIQAIQSQLDKIVEQQERQTEAVKTIEARIGGELWNEQERWKLKRDIYMSLIEYWSHVSAMLEDALLPSKPNWAGYWVQKQGLERQAESRKARALSYMVFSKPLLVQLKRIEETIERISLDKRLWEMESSADTQGLLKALTIHLVRSVVEDFAAVAAEDLKAFGTDAQADFERRHSDRQREQKLLDQLVKDEEISVEDLEWLRARLPKERD